MAPDLKFFRSLAILQDRIRIPPGSRASFRVRTVRLRLQRHRVPLDGYVLNLADDSGQRVQSDHTSPGRVAVAPDTQYPDQPVSR